MIQPEVVVEIIMAAMKRAQTGEFEGDTFDREVLFWWASDRFEIPYEDLYQAWLNNDFPLTPVPRYGDIALRGLPNG